MNAKNTSVKYNTSSVEAEPLTFSGQLVKLLDITTVQCRIGHSFLFLPVEVMSVLATRVRGVCPHIQKQLTGE
jgi:hypothetical protein